MNQYGRIVSELKFSKKFINKNICLAVSIARTYFQLLGIFLFCFVSVRLEFSAPGMQVNTMCLSLARNYSLIYLGLLTFFFAWLLRVLWNRLLLSLEGDWMLFSFFSFVLMHTQKSYIFTVNLRCIPMLKNAKEECLEDTDF